MVEEFTFPTVVLPADHYRCDKQLLVPFPRFGGGGASPPPPWFVVSSAGAAAATQDHHRRCFSAVVVEHADAGAGAGCRDDGHDGCCCYRRGSERLFADAAVKEEHRMDLLWEDFNEELSRAAAACPISKEWGTEAWLPGVGDGTSRDVTPTGGSSVVRPRRRLSLMMMLKLLRRLFMARKSKAAAASSSLPQGGGGRRHQYD